MKAVNAYTPIEQLSLLVNLSIHHPKAVALPVGRLEQLKILFYRLQRIRNFDQEKGLKKRVGVFGAPKRGKSTLLNTLLGVDILPTSQVPLSTTTIEIESVPDMAGWNLILNHASGRIEEKDCNSAQEIAKLLETYGSRRGPNESAQRLRLTGAFPECKILSQGGVLLDTPGAEVAFEVDKNLDQEAQRAIDALKTTHLVLFCIRADQVGSRSDSELYEKHVRSLAPVHVVTMKDKWTDDMGSLADEVLYKYGLTQSAPVLVSAKEAKDSSMLEMSGLPSLEETVLAELNSITPEHGLLTNLKSFELAVEDFPEIRPPRIHFHNLHLVIEELHQEWSREALNYMNQKSGFWAL